MTKHGGRLCFLFGLALFVPTVSAFAEEAPSPVLQYWLQYGAPFAEFCGNNLYLFLAAIGLLLVNWELPRFLIQREKGPGNREAIDAEMGIRLWGLYPYFVYLNQKRGKRKKIRAAHQEILTQKNGASSVSKASLEASREIASCPHCNKAIQLEDFTDTVQLEKCPHCLMEIEARFTYSELMQGLVDKVDGTLARKKRKRKNDDPAHSQAMQELLLTMYRTALKMRATDIHIERNETGASVQYRVDGILNDMFKTSAEMAPGFLSAIKVQANLNITNHMTPQDGRYNLTIEGIDLDFRINCAPTSSMGEILFMRLLDKRNILLNPGALGFEGKNLEAFQNAIHRPHGLVLVTGPTGSGKSTTLYVALNQINTGERNIVTIEDPVEYQLPRLKQMQVNPQKGFTFATGLRSMLRQDPDVIMVGEIRDSETANMAIDAASTGHLVFTTLHTMDTAGAISRLADLGVPAKRYANALELIVAQRLVRLICPECKDKVEASESLLQKLGIRRLPEGAAFYKGKGCDHCNYTGFFGRQALLEVLQPDEKLRDVLLHETKTSLIRNEARQRGMKLLREQGVIKALAGETTLDEVARTTS